MIDSDEEIIFDDGDFDDSQLQHDFEMLDDNWTSISMLFNPYQSEVKKLKVRIISIIMLHNNFKQKTNNDHYYYKV